MKDLLKAVCSRLTGRGGEIGSIIRLHTQYGGGKTHGLIALVHAARGMKGVPNPGDFVSPEPIPTVPVRVAALDGENSDPTNGLTLEGNLRAYSIWGNWPIGWLAQAATSACAKATASMWRPALRLFASSSAANQH
jgi:hypothetical protein